MSFPALNQAPSMDYSAVAVDPALPGSSPWGSSSPRADRSGYSRQDSDVPQSPAPITGHAHSRSQDSISANPFASEPGTPAIQQQQPPSPEHQGPRQQTQAASSAASKFQDGGPPYQQRQQQGMRPGAARYDSARPQRPVPAYKLQAKVTALERTGRKDPVIRFDVYTNLPKFRTTQFRDVRRTHSEFIKLSEHLISSNSEALVPAVPPSLTSAGAGTDEDETRVKGSIQRWLNCVCGNDVLMRDEEMVFFVESDFGYSPVVRMKQPATGVRRKVLKQFAPPSDDTPELHEARPVVKAFYLGALDAAQKMERVVRSRRALGLSESSLGEKFTVMAPQEPHPGLANAYRKLGRVVQNTGDYHAAQGTAEATTLGDVLSYYASDAFIVKETLTNRHILLRELVQAEQSRRSKETAVTRLKSATSVKKDKVDEAISALDEAMSQENYLKGKTQRVTANLLLEKRKWMDRTGKEMIESVREYTLRQIEAERRTLATLESVRMDIRAVDASGGLSRLGRESHPTIKRISMASSQTAKGDAWSGVQRSRDAMTRSMSGSFAGGVPQQQGEEDNIGKESSKPNGAGVAAAAAAAAESPVTGRPRSGTGAASLGSVKEDDEDDDRMDAKNAASRLAQSTF